MSDTSAVAEPPVADLETDASDTTGAKPYVISEHRKSVAVVTLLGKDVENKDGSKFTRKFFHVKKIYKTDDQAKWQSISYFQKDELADLELAIAEARNAQHTK